MSDFVRTTLIMCLAWIAFVITSFIFSFFISFFVDSNDPLTELLRGWMSFLIHLSLFMVMGIVFMAVLITICVIFFNIMDAILFK